MASKGLVFTCATGINEANWHCKRKPSIRQRITSVAIANGAVLVLVLDRVLCEAVVQGRKNPLHAELPERLARTRKAAGFSQAGLALASGLADSTAVHDLENGIRIPRVDTVERLADALGVSPCWLAFGIESDFVPSAALRVASLPHRLREARQGRGISARALGRDSRTSDTTVRLTERGETIPNLTKLEALAAALGVSPCWLAFGVGPAPVHVAG
jgi:transcriptional regulator with XRE-family HTH domain